MVLLPLTPDEIRQRDLPRSLRGYRQTETRELIEEAAAAYEAALAELERARESASGREGEAEAIVKALLTAERTAEEMVAEARQDASAIVAEARATAERMTAEARAARDELAPAHEAMVHQAETEAALILSAAERQAEALREEQQRVHASIERMRGQFVALVETALARLEQPLDREIAFLDDLTARVGNATD
jgi:cell division initiation protein